MADKTHIVGEIVFIPDAYFVSVLIASSTGCSCSSQADPEASDAADDVKDMGVAPVPSINRHQQLKDAGLVISHSVNGGYLEFSEAWSAEHIDQRWLALLAPKVWEYMEATHEPLDEGDHWWLPLYAEQGRLKVFSKKGALNGQDLATVKTGKGKRVDQSTLYFGKRSHASTTLGS